MGAANQNFKNKLDGLLNEKPKYNRILAQKAASKAAPPTEPEVQSVVYPVRQENPVRQEKKKYNLKAIEDWIDGKPIQSRVNTYNLAPEMDLLLRRRLNESFPHMTPEARQVLYEDFSANLSLGIAQKHTGKWIERTRRAYDNIMDWLHNPERAYPREPVSSPDRTYEMESNDEPSTESTGSYFGLSLKAFGGIFVGFAWGLDKK